jgi:hypothetical protein
MKDVRFFEDFYQLMTAVSVAGVHERPFYEPWKYRG